MRSRVPVLVLSAAGAIVLTISFLLGAYLPAATFNAHARNGMCVSSASWVSLPCHGDQCFKVYSCLRIAGVCSQYNTLGVTTSKEEALQWVADFGTRSGTCFYDPTTSEEVCFASWDLYNAVVPLALGCVTGSAAIVLVVIAVIVWKRERGECW